MRPETPPGNRAGSSDNTAASCGSRRKNSAVRSPRQSGPDTGCGFQAAAPPQAPAQQAVRAAVPILQSEPGQGAQKATGFHGKGLPRVTHQRGPLGRVLRRRQAEIHRAQGRRRRELELAQRNRVKKNRKKQGRFVVNRSFFLPHAMVYCKMYAVRFR